MPASIIWSERETGRDKEITMDVTTRNDLKSNAKKKSIDLLNARLAEAIDIGLMTKQAHWNVKGP